MIKIDLLFFSESHVLTTLKMSVEIFKKSFKVSIGEKPPHLLEILFKQKKIEIHGVEKKYLKL